MAAATSAERRNLLAPESVTRLSTHVQELRADMWEITMGDAVPAFVHANGPAKVVTYNFLLEKGAKVQSQLVTRRPVDRSGSELQDKHDLADFFDLTGVRSRGLPAHQKEAPVLDFFARPVLTTWTLLKMTTTVRQGGSAYLHRRYVVCGLQNWDGTQACEKSNIAPRQLCPARGGEHKTTLPPPAQGAKLRNFGACTCGHQNYLMGDRWCSHVPGAKLRNFGPHTCGHQRSPARSVGAYTCGPQSYVTLLLTRVDPNVCPTGWTLGSSGVRTKVT